MVGAAVTGSMLIFYNWNFGKSNNCEKDDVEIDSNSEEEERASSEAPEVDILNSEGNTPLWSASSSERGSDVVQPSLSDKVCSSRYESGEASPISE